MIFSIAIAYMAALASWTLVFTCLQAYYWAWASAVVACIAATLTYELTEAYMTRRVWPMLGYIARGTVAITVDLSRSIRRVYQGARHV